MRRSTTDHVIVGFSMPAELLRQIDLIAATRQTNAPVRRVSRSAVLREIVEAYFAGPAAPPTVPASPPVRTRKRAPGS